MYLYSVDVPKYEAILSEGSVRELWYKFLKIKLLFWKQQLPEAVIVFSLQAFIILPVQLWVTACQISNF